MKADLEMPCDVCTSVLAMYVDEYWRRRRCNICFHTCSTHVIVIPRLPWFIVD